VGGRPHLGARARAGARAPRSAAPRRSPAAPRRAPAAPRPVAALVVAAGLAAAALLLHRLPHPAGSTGSHEVAAVRGAPLTGPVRPGDHGRDVRAVQAALAALGVDPGVEDGAFGAATRRAVATFQAGHGLPTTGVVAGATAAALTRALEAATGREAATVRGGLDAALAAGRLPAADARAARTALGRATREAARAGPAAAGVLLAALRDVAGEAGAYDGPRVRALTGTLAVNARAGGPPAGRLYVGGAGGTVYRYYPGHGFQLNPLASFAALNADVAHRRLDAARRLAEAMLARGISTHGGLVWEYAFPFGGPAPWTSGFAQAVAADALGRAARALDEPRLARAAHAAVAAIPAGYLSRVPGGVWIREYSFSGLLTLNAQLQTFLSLRDDARTTGDATAGRLAEGMRSAARRLLPRFDLGCWSRYALAGSPADDHYARYHVSLLRRMTAATGDPYWGRVAARWAAGLHAGCATR
jgi:peptidoglycan hydrolase-like protein with peptidoglycan-binding domain